VVPHFLGQNPDEVDALASELDANADAIENVIRNLSGQIDDTTWVGTDRTRFEGAWVGSLSANLRSVAGSLKDAAAVARTNAREQRDGLTARRSNNTTV